MIYFMQPVDGGPIKIGYSSDVLRRKKELEQEYSSTLVILGVAEGERELEAEIHKMFGHLRIGIKELFEPERELLDYIANNPTIVDQNPEATLASLPPAREVIAHLKGTREYSDWLEEAHRDTLIPKASIIRQALREWAEKRGRRPPPEI